MATSSSPEDWHGSQHYEYLFQSTSDGVLIADAEFIVRHANPAAAGMLGMTIEELLHRHVGACFGKNPPLLNLFERAGEQKLEVRLPRRRLAQGVANTLANGERMVILQDVTEKRDLDTRREMLSRTIAHDLRNPISAIGGFMDLLDKLGELNDPQRKFLARARQTTTKLHDMIATLVELAWIEAGMPLQHAPVRLDELIQRAVDVLQPTARKHNVGIVLSIQRPLPLVMGDAERLEMAIFQLLQNAILYSHPEKNVVIHAWQDEHELYCSVADQGIGVADSEVELIFDRMYRSRDERVNDIAGGGLGLTIARTIVHRHGGDIWASSNLNVGSTFTFVLPSVQP